jgi:hypothetical protein
MVDPYFTGGKASIFLAARAKVWKRKVEDFEACKKRRFMLSNRVCFKHHLSGASTPVPPRKSGAVKYGVV